MTAMITAAVGGALISGVMSNKAAGKQSDAINRSTDQQVAEQQRQYDLSRADFAPWREAGSNALNMLEDPTKNFYASPDFDFRMNEGMDTLGGQFAMKGGGGNAMKALEGYRSNLASGEFGNWWDRQFAQSEAGRGATGTVGALGANKANNISGAYANQGANMANIQGQKYANINNAIQSGISGALFGYQAGRQPNRGGGGR